MSAVLVWFLVMGGGHGIDTIGKFPTQDDCERARIASGMDTLSLHLIAALRCMRDTAPAPTVLLH